MGIYLCLPTPTPEAGKDWGRSRFSPASARRAAGPFLLSLLLLSLLAGLCWRSLAAGWALSALSKTIFAEASFFLIRPLAHHFRLFIHPPGALRNHVLFRTRDYEPSTIFK
mmetsp:Transcript_8424/g.14668  ORF Transcript_8424/g.14668 Transcript_8424/m.14668 type:complete len:111 (-) Transcript_8424:311-643(-)